MFYIYILFSENSGYYYTGHTDDPEKRLSQHNSDEKNTFTRKFRPWKLVYKYPVSDLRSEALIIEKYLKKRRSKSLLENLISKKSDTIYQKKFFSKILLKRGKKIIDG